MNGRRLYGVVVLLLLLALGLQLRHAWARYRAGRILARVEAETVQAAAVRQLSRALFERNLRDLELAAALAPAEVLVPIQRAGQYVLMNRQEAAVRTYLEALELEPRAEIYRNLGQVQWAQGEHALARESFQRALWLDHTLYRPLRKYLPRERRVSGGKLILEEGFESGRLGGDGLGRKVEILQESFDSGRLRAFEVPPPEAREQAEERPPRRRQARRDGSRPGKERPGAEKRRRDNNGF